MRESGLTSVHVLAEEMAFVAPAVHQVDLVASDDATTCSVVLLISDRIVAVAHLDSENQMAFYLKKWESLVNSPITQVAIAGGYDDERNIARPISMDILRALMVSEAVYDVQQIVTGRWNTTETDNGVKLPRTRGIGYFPAEDVFRRVEFEPDARLPLVSLRFAGVSPHPLHTLLCCLEKDKPLEITVGPYYATLLSPEGSSWGMNRCRAINRTSTMEPSFVANPYVRTSAPKPPLKTLAVSRHDLSNRSSRRRCELHLKTPKHIQERIPICLDNMSRPQSVAAVTSRKFVKRKDALITGGFTRPAEVFPSLGIV
ncbi:Protein N-terminal asparagine amidohydrolase [Phytophthora cactorum]|nr:Protein N-terminal asparagine amidohydrolase [Phytophthora cactorum]